jgi:PKD repeat protein
MLLLLAIGVDAGRMFFSWIEVTNAAREGAAYAAGNPTDTTGITTMAEQEGSSQAQAGDGTSYTVTTGCHTPAGSAIACAFALGGNATGNTVTVSVARTFGFITPLVGNVLGNNFSLRGTSTSSVFGLVPNGGESQPGDCNDPRQARFTFSQSDMTVTLDASDSTPNSGLCAISSYDWDMGDGANPFPPVVGKQTSYTYAAAGTYTITLTTSNPGGVETTTHSVTVPPVVSASVSPSPTATASPTSSTPADPACTMVASFSWNEQGNSKKVNFYGAYTGQPAPASWYWTFGDGWADYGQAPSRHSYSDHGPYTVTLTTTNGSCSATISQEVSP